MIELPTASWNAEFASSYMESALLDVYKFLCGHDLLELIGDI
jgi:hypothetical protein